MRFGRVLVTGSAGLLGRYVIGELKPHCEPCGFDLTPTEAIPHSVGDMTDARAVRNACKGVDAVVHIAAMPNIWAGPPSRIMSVNVMGTWNLLNAAEEAGVKRVVVTSSDSVVGFTVREGRMIPPSYLPIDERHPLRPTDPYALSKKLVEEMGRSFVDRGKLEVLAIRPVYILYPQMECEVLARAQDPSGYKGPAAGGRQPAGGGPAWHYVDPRDVARAFRCALEVPQMGFDVFFISAAATLAPEPTLERLSTFSGRVTEVRRPEVYTSNPYAPLYDLFHARDVLKFEARYDRRELLKMVLSR